MPGQNYRFVWQSGALGRVWQLPIYEWILEEGKILTMGGSLERPGRHTEAEINVILGIGTLT